MSGLRLNEVKITNDRETMVCRSCDWGYALDRETSVEQADAAWMHLKAKHGARSYQADSGGLYAVVYTAMTVE